MIEPIDALKDKMIMVCKILQKQGVIVRPMGGYQLGDWIRISVGTPAENERCLKVLAAVLGRS